MNLVVWASLLPTSGGCSETKLSRLPAVSREEHGWNSKHTWLKGNEYLGNRYLEAVCRTAGSWGCTRLNKARRTPPWIIHNITEIYTQVPDICKWRQCPYFRLCYCVMSGWEVSQIVTEMLLMGILGIFLQYHRVKLRKSLYRFIVLDILGDFLQYSHFARKVFHVLFSLCTVFPQKFQVFSLYCGSRQRNIQYLTQFQYFSGR